MAFTANWSVEAYEQPTVAKWNQLGANDDNLDGRVSTLEASGGFMGFSVKLSTNQVLNTGSLTKINYNTKVFDIGDNFNTSTNIYTVPQTGYYQLFVRFITRQLSSASERITALIYVNGSQVYSEKKVGEDSFRYLSYSTILQLAVGDEVEVRGLANVAVSVQLESSDGGESTSFKGYKIG